MDSNPLSVLVSGSSGFICTHVVRHLHAAGHQVTGIDHIPPKNPLPEGVAFHVCDIRKGDLPDRTFDAVVHLAALAGVRPSMDRPLEYEITNIIGTIRLLEFCRRMGIPPSFSHRRPASMARKRRCRRRNRPWPTRATPTP